VPTGGGALAIDPTLNSPDGNRARVFAFAPFSHGGDGIYPSYTVIANKVSVEASSENVAEFPPWTPLPAMSGHPNGEAAAVTFEFSFGRRILLLFPDVNGVLQYTLIEPDYPTAGTPWRPVPGWVSYTRARQASVAVVKAGPGTADDRIDIVFRDIAATDDEDHIYVTSIGYDGTWAQAPTLQAATGSDKMRSYFTPGITEAPNGYVYLATMNANPATLLLRVQAGLSDQRRQAAILRRRSHRDGCTANRPNRSHGRYRGPGHSQQHERVSDRAWGQRADHAVEQVQPH